jgi:hypothetical protein
MRLTGRILHSEHGEAHVNFVLYSSGWAAYREDGTEYDDRKDYEEDRLFRLGQGPLLDFPEVCSWLAMKGWEPLPESFVGTLRVLAIKWSRGKTLSGEVLQYDDKAGSARIIVDKAADPPEYRVFVREGNTLEMVKPPRKKRQRVFPEGWWRLKDAKAAALAAINEDELPHTGTKPSLPKYDTYDPEEEGYGSPEQWRATFEARIGRAECELVLDGEGPRAVLDLSVGATQKEIKSAYRKLIGKWHPDKHGNSARSAEMARKIKAAYELLRSD